MERQTALKEIERLASEAGIAIIATDINDASCLNKGAKKMIRYQAVPAYYVPSLYNPKADNSICHVGSVASHVKQVSRTMFYANRFNGFLVYCDKRHNDALSKLETMEQVQGYFGAELEYLFEVRQERGPSEFKRKLKNMGLL